MPKDKLSSRERLLQEAAQLIHTQGFERTSVSDLLEAAGVKKGSFYFHFGSKKELAILAMERMHTRFMDFVDASLAGGTPEARLRGFLDAALSIHRKMGFVGGCPWGNAALEMSDADEDFAQLVAGVFEEWVGKIEGVIAEGQAAGQFRDDMAPRSLARHVVAVIEGGIMLSRVRKHEGPLRDCLDSLKAMLKPVANGHGIQRASAGR